MTIPTNVAQYIKEFVENDFTCFVLEGKMFEIRRASNNLGYAFEVKVRGQKQNYLCKDLKSIYDAIAEELLEPAPFITI